MKCSIAASPFVEGWFYPSSDYSFKAVHPFSSLFSSLKEPKQILGLSECSGEKGTNVSRDNEIDMDANSREPSDSQLFLEREIFFKQRKESVHGLTFLVGPFEFPGCSKKLHLLQKGMMALRTGIFSNVFFSRGCMKLPSKASPDLTSMEVGRGWFSGRMEA